MVPIRFGLYAAAMLVLGACNARNNPQNIACAAEAEPGGLHSMPWGFYPGYGCGPVPPARIIYP